MRIFGVNFAPLHVPIERRLQTLCTAIILGICAFGGPVCFCILVLLCLYGNNWIRILLLFYLCFAYYDRNRHIRGGRNNWFTKWLSNCAWVRHTRNYFPVNVIKTVDLDPSRNYLFTGFPHGVFAIGVTIGLATNISTCMKLFPGLRFKLTILDVHFLIPLFREYPLNSGACGCSEESLKYLLTHKPKNGSNSGANTDQGHAVILFPGGTSEALISKPGTYRILAKRRKGFVRVALQEGVPLVPVFSFGENDYYEQLIFKKGSLLLRLQKLFQSYVGMAPPMINGRGFFQYSFGLIPKRTPINVVVGAPIELPKIPEPTKEDIDKYHARFIEKLTELFETHKSKYVADFENKSLIFDD